MKLTVTLSGDAPAVLALATLLADEAKMRDVEVVNHLDVLQPAEATHSFDMPLDKLGLRGRVYNALRRQNIDTIGELLEKHTEASLLDIRGFGPDTLDDVRTKLKLLGLVLTAS